MSFQLVDFQEILSDSESDVDFTAERMTNKLVDIDTSLQLDDEALLRFVDDNKAKNTVKKTKSDMNLWYRWCTSVGEKRKIEEIEDLSEVNRLLSHFFMNVKKQDGTEYEPTTLRDCQRSIERHLVKNCGKTYSILRDSQFASSRDVLASKSKFLRRELGKGRKPNKAAELSEEDIEKFWQNGQLGRDNPRQLLNTVWFNNITFFGWRGNDEHYRVLLGDIARREETIDGELCKYYEWLVERGAKTRDSANADVQEREFDPKIWAIGGPRCPYDIMTEYLNRRCESMKKPDSPLYLAVIDNPSTDVWYKDQRLGIKKLQSMLKDMAKSVGIDSKRITNHSARRTMIRALKHNGVDRYDICQLSGHRNPKSIDSYSALSNGQQHQLSKILSNRVCGGQSSS